MHITWVFKGWDPNLKKHCSQKYFRKQFPLSCHNNFALELFSLSWIVKYLYGKQINWNFLQGCQNAQTSHSYCVPLFKIKSCYVKLWKIFRDGVFETSQTAKKCQLRANYCRCISLYCSRAWKKRGQDLPESVSSWMTGLKLCRKVFPQNSSNRAHSPRSSPSEEKHHIKCELQSGQEPHYYIIQMYIFGKPFLLKQMTI